VQLCRHYTDKHFQSSMFDAKMGLK